MARKYFSIIELKRQGGSRQGWHSQCMWLGMRVETTKNLMVDLIMREKYSPVAKFDGDGQVHRIDGECSEFGDALAAASEGGDVSGDASGGGGGVSVQKVVDVARAYGEGCRCEKIGVCDEGGVKVDPIKGGVADIPASLGGWGGTVGNLLDVFG